MLLRFALAVAFILQALRCATQPQSLSVQHLTLENGLSQGNIESIYQDSRGFIWMGTISGLNRYDGQRIYSYQPDPNSSTSIRGNNIQSQFFEDKDGNIWFSTYEAINCYVRRDDNFRHYTLTGADANPLLGYYLAGIDKNGLLWAVVQPNQLYTLDIRTGKQSFWGNTAPKTNAASLCFDPTGSPKSILSYSYGQPGLQINTIGNDALSEATCILDGKNGQPAVISQKALLEGDSLLWFSAGSRGIGYFQIQTGKLQFFKEGTAPDFAVVDIVLSLKNRMWVSTNGTGLWLFDRKTHQFTGHWQHDPNDPHSIGGNDLHRIYNDRDGNLWININNSSMDFFCPEKARFQAFYSKSGQKDDAKHQLGALLEMPDGRVIACADSKAVCIFNADGMLEERIENEKGKSPNLPAWPLRLAFDGKGRLWLLSWQGLGLWEPASRRFRTISDQTFLATCLLKNGTLLLAGLKGGIYAMEESKNASFSLKLQEGIGQETAFTSLYEDARGRLWGCANAADVSLYAPGNNGWNLLRTLGVHGETKAYTEDTEKQIMWLATSEGLAKVDLNTFKPTFFTEKDGLPNLTLYSVLPDDRGFYWIGTNRGISRFDPDRIQFQNFDRTDGLPNLEFNSSAFVKRKNGEFWFGTQGGGVAFYPERVNLIATAARPMITRILVNDQPDSTLRCAITGAKNVAEIKSLNFEYERNTLSFEFAALEFSNPARNRFRYQMYGVDKAPVEAGMRGFARYADLNPGVYKMLVWTANSDGVWNPAPYSLDIYVAPPFWETWWFITLMVLFALMLGYALYRYRIAQLRREFQLKDLAQRNEVKAAQNELKALRAQMSPHFLFNALNSINAAVLDGNTQKASDLIGRFAGLMRSILVHSKQNTVSLADELKQLETYMQLEKQRFNPPFTYEIQVSPDIDADDEPMPTMILQPFVENAIWHGIQHLPVGSGPGHISIQIRKEAQFLHCLIEDNGIGRKRSGELRRFQHQSQGMSITAERLRLLPGENRMVVEDLYDTDGNACGTRVALWLGT